MKRLNLAVFLMLVLVGLATPIFADRVDITSTAGLGNLIQNENVTLTGQFSANLHVEVYFNSSNGVYTYVYRLSQPSRLIDGPALTINHGALFDLAGLNYGLINGVGWTSEGFDIDFIGTNPDGSTFFIFDDFDSGDSVTVYAQSTQPPDEMLANLLENLTHRRAGGRLPPPVPEPGTLLLLGGGLSLASLAIRRRLSNRKKA
ncbi:MAG: PEP-CTERM sorting domain-containing protein [Acidobacteria bacterium]|nr:PEP-CTERM sorting domain-containing protein [Acidobacteriota bacterium]MBI3655284.1 PEP-CTERM sorting domain-containing protein [Acidobacteriota bacterium]